MSWKSKSAFNHVLIIHNFLKNIDAVWYETERRATKYGWPWPWCKYYTSKAPVLTFNTFLEVIIQTKYFKNPPQSDWVTPSSQGNSLLRQNLKIFFLSNIYFLNVYILFPPYRLLFILPKALENSSLKLPALCKE